MPPVNASSSNVNLTSIGVDTLTESYFAGAAQDMTERKKQVGSRMNAGLRDMNGKRDKQIRELNKYAKELTKGGFFKMFLKVLNFVMKMLNPVDTILGKVMKGKLKWLRMALTFAAQIAMMVVTFGGSAALTVAQQAMKAVEKVIRIVQLVANVTQSLTESGIGMMDMVKQKSMALHQKDAEKFKTLAMQAEKTVEKTTDEIRRIQKEMNQLISRASETINIEEAGREALTKL